MNEMTNLNRFADMEVEEFLSAGTDFLLEEIRNKTEAEKHLEKALELVQKQIKNYEHLLHGDPDPIDFYPLSYFERLEQLIQYVFENVEDDDIIECNDEHYQDVKGAMIVARHRERMVN